MDTLGQDLRLALRKLRHAPGFTCVAVLTLALGLGANTAIFSVVNAVLLRPLPMEHSERLVRVYSQRGALLGPYSSLDFLDTRAQARSFEGLTAVTELELNAAGGLGEPERLRGGQVSAEFFSVMGLRLQRGRAFQPGEDRPGQGRVVVLGHGLWLRRYGGDAAVLGRTLTLNGRPHTVVGVAAPEVDFPLRAQLWVPLLWEGDMVDPENRGSHFLEVYGRLKEGVGLEQAGADLAQVARGLEARFPRTNTGKGAALLPLREELVGDVRPALLLLLGAVGVVLLIACANLSNLLLARAVAREGEMSVRAALGASRGRIVRQLLVESVALAALGGAAGLMLASWGLDVLAALAPADFPLLDKVEVDGPVLAFTSGLALTTAVVFGLLPALQASRVELSAGMREVGRGGVTGARSRARHLLVVGELALAMVLLVSAGLLLQSFQRLAGVDVGFNTERVVTFELELPEPGYPAGAPQTRAFFETLLERVRGLPGVEAAGATLLLPMNGGIMRSVVRDLARPEPAPGQEDQVLVHLVTPGYLETLGVPLLEGRLLTPGDGDGEGKRAVLLSEEAARRYWPGESALGRTVEVGVSLGQGTFGGTVVGVVGGTRFLGVAREVFPEVYVPYAQGASGNMHLVVRASGAPEALVPALRAQVRALDASLPVANVRTLEGVVGGSVARPRFYLTLVGLFALLALSLAALGIYGVVSHAVSQRTRELGIRMALGANPRELVGLVLVQYLRLTGLGLAAGVLLAVLASRLLTGLLYGVRGTEPLTYVGVAAVLGAVSVVASFLPAHRATRIDPVVALKQE
jgi:predicted permease